MGIIARQSIKGALANYIGVFIGFLTTFFVLTNCLTQEEIGLTRVMVDAALLFSGLAQLGTNSSIIRFYPYFKDPEKRDHGFFGWTILLPFIGFTIFTICFFVFKENIIHIYSERSPLIVDYFYLLLPLTFFALYQSVFEINASVLLRITVPKIIREIGIRLFNLVAYILYGADLISLDMFVILFCSAYGIATLLNFFYLISLGKISFKIDFKFVDRKFLKEICQYTLFMTATVLAGNIALINSLFLGAKASLALAGIYTIASYIANVIEIPYRSLGAISQPMIAQAMKDHDRPEVNRLCKQVSLHQFLISSLLFYFIWINLAALFAIIPNGEDYVSGMGVVFFLGLAKIINSSFCISSNVLNYSRYYMLALPLIAILTLSAIFLNNYLIPLWGLNGSACATLFAYLIYFVLLLSLIQWKLKVNLFSRGQLTIIAIVLILFGIDYLWQLGVTHLFQLDSIIALLINSVIKSILFALLAATAIYKLKISLPVNAIIDKFLTKIKR